MEKIRMCEYGKEQCKNCPQAIRENGITIECKFEKEDLELNEQAYEEYLVWVNN